jgi:hypothetical protein
MVEYYGKQISKTGLSMSKKKINKVSDFPKPTTAGQMKQFVGLKITSMTFVHTMPR